MVLYCLKTGEKSSKLSFFVVSFAKHGRYVSFNNVSSLAKQRQFIDQDKALYHSDVSILCSLLCKLLLMTLNFVTERNENTKNQNMCT